MRPQKKPKNLEDAIRKGQTDVEARVKHTAKPNTWKIDEETENFQHAKVLICK